MAGEPQILQRRMSAEDALQMADDTFGDMFKLVVDVERSIVAVGGMLHADAEALLVEEGSAKGDIWGANYFPRKEPGACLEYTALINIRSSDRNPDQYILSEATRARVRSAVEKWIGPA